MTTWHQQQAMKRYPEAYLPGDGWVLVSDSPGGMQSRMNYCMDEQAARVSLIAHRRAQPDIVHTLYHNGRPVA